MKGVIFSTSFFILSITMFLSLTWYVNYDNYRSIINNNFKKSLSQTAYIVSDYQEIDEGKVIDTIVNEVKDSIPSDFEYKFEMLGFNEDPILLRVRLHCTSHNKLYNYTLEETIIETELVDEKK